MKHRNLRSRSLSVVLHSFVVIALMIFLASPQIAVGQSQPTFDQVVEAAIKGLDTRSEERSVGMIVKALSTRHELPEQVTESVVELNCVSVRNVISGDNA